MSTCMPHTGSSSGAMGRVVSMATSWRVLRFLSWLPSRLTHDGPPAPPPGGRTATNGVTMDELITPPEPVRAEGGPTATAAARPAQASLARIGLLGIAAAALIAAAILAVGWASAPSSLLAAGSTGTDQPATVIDLNGGGGPGFGRGHGGITITSISGNSISLKTEDGWTRTITVDSGTTYSKAGATIALGDLAVGDQIGFRQTKES